MTEDIVHLMNSMKDDKVLMKITDKLMKITTLTKFPLRKKTATVNVKSENYKEKSGAK